jgi:hypothetical protein
MLQAPGYGPYPVLMKMNVHPIVIGIPNIHEKLLAAIRQPLRIFDRADVEPQDGMVAVSGQGSIQSARCGSPIAPVVGLGFGI